jgi:hypothetical protein
VRGERDRRGWAVRGFMARARNDTASRAPSLGVHAKPRVVPPRSWPRGNARFGGIPRACVEGALTRVRAEKMREPRNPINGLLAPQGLVRLFAGYQMRPKCRSVNVPVPGPLVRSCPPFFRISRRAARHCIKFTREKRDPVYKGNRTQKPYT